jgi:hypothetical protein
MDTAIYVGLSRQLTLQRALEISANNLANVDTAGFKVETLVINTDGSRYYDITFKNALASTDVDLIAISSSVLRDENNSMFRTLAANTKNRYNVCRVILKSISLDSDVLDQSVFLRNIKTARAILEIAAKYH